MKTLIFGAGRSFVEFYEFSKEFWNESKIVAILDNDEKKWGGGLLWHSYYIAI